MKPGHAKRVGTSPTLSLYANTVVLLRPGLAHGSKASGADMHAAVFAVHHHALGLYIRYPAARSLVSRVANIGAVTWLFPAHITHYRHAVTPLRALY